MSKRIVILMMALVALFSVSLTALAESLIVNLKDGDVLEINCEGNTLALVRLSKTKATAACKGRGTAPTSTPISQPTNTPIPPATNTPVPPATNTPVPPPTDTPPGGDLAGKECPAWVHDRHVVQGPDGSMYPTWHPQVDPDYGCYFTHEHGADPRSSNIFTQMPPFGYVDKLAGMNTPHEGFKVFVLNRGTYTQDGRNVRDDHLMHFHMGTAVVGRYTAQFHEFSYAYRGDRGEFRVTGLADTGRVEQVGSTCDSPRRGGRDFSTIGCNDPYEIWNNVHFSIIHPDDPYQDPMHVRLYVSGSVAAFDPVTTRDPADSSRLVYTMAYRQPGENVDPLSSQSWYRGCNREGYFGPHFSNNTGRDTTYWTDVYGRVQSGAATGGLIQQQVNMNNNTDNTIYKWAEDFCSQHIHAPN